MEITFTLEQIITFGAAIGALAGLFSMIAAPIRKLNTKLDGYDQKFSNDQQKIIDLETVTQNQTQAINNLNTTLSNQITNEITALRHEIHEHEEETGKEIKMQGKMIYQMLDHMATNNNTGGMKKYLQEYSEFYMDN